MYKIYHSKSEMISYFNFYNEWDNFNFSNQQTLLIIIILSFNYLNLLKKIFLDDNLMIQLLKFIEENIFQ